LVIKTILWIGLIAVLIVGCLPQSSDAALTPVKNETAVPIESIIKTPILEPVRPSATPQPDQEEEIMTAEANEKPTIPPGGDLWIAKARENLAQRQKVTIDQIELVTFENKVWRDSSLGCPQPGMFYKQVLSDGYFIQLRIGDELFNYHGGTGRAPFLCTQGE
jgi:hypothetical protein